MMVLTYGACLVYPFTEIKIDGVRVSIPDYDDHNLWGDIRVWSKTHIPESFVVFHRHEYHILDDASAVLFRLRFR